MRYCIQVKMKKNLVIHKGAVVTLDNALIRACHGLSLNEKRIIMYAVAKSNSKNRAPDKNLLISAKEFGEMYKLDPSNAYSMLKEAGKNLYNRSISWSTDAYLVHQRWIQRCKYWENEGYFELKWSDDIMPYLFKITKSFTRYRLSQASALRSIHAWKLLELMEQFRENTGYVILEAEELYNILDLSIYQRKDFAQVRRIIDPAIKELKEKEGYKIYYETKKRGRKVSKIVFNVNRNLEPRLL